MICDLILIIVLSLLVSLYFILHTLNIFRHIGKNHNPLVYVEIHSVKLQFFIFILRTFFCLP